MVLEDANGEMQIMFEYPRPPRFPFSPGLGEMVQSLRGSPATSEKKNEVLTVVVLGVCGAPFGVFNIDANPPGENKPFAVGDCSQARTFELSNIAEFGCFP